MRCAVIGHPVAHSLSPAIHRAAHRWLGLDWDYEAVDVEPGGLAAFIEGLDDQWRGLSVTMPHKVDLVTMGETDETVRLLGVANTWVRDGGHTLVRNTDVTGAAAAMASRGVDAPNRVVVLGAGATARSVLAATVRAGAREAVVASRSVERSRRTLDLADRLGVQVSWTPIDEVRPDCDLLVSTVPARAVSDRAEDLVAGAAAVFDVIYDPWPTPLTAAARRAGRPTVDGLDLLACQALDQVRLMTGREVPGELLRSAAQNGLEERSGL